MAGIGGHIRKMAALGILAAVGACAAGPRTLLLDAPATQAATQKDLPWGTKDVAAAALELTRRLEKSRQDTAYTRMLAQHLQNVLLKETATLMHQEDPEVAARGAGIIAFNAGISDFLAEQLAGPDTPERDAWISWCLADAHLRQVAQVYSPSPDTRIHAAALLADVPGENGDRLLARLIADKDREVSLRALDAAWDRPPGNAVIYAALQKGLGYAITQAGGTLQPDLRVLSGTQQQSDVVAVHGRPVAFNELAMASAYGQMDGAVAIDLLVHYRDPKTRAAVNTLVLNLGSTQTDGTVLARLVSPNYGVAYMDFFRLTGSINPPDLLPTLIAGLSKPIVGNDGYSTDVNGKIYRFSSRLDLMAHVVTLLGESPPDYGLVQLPNWGNRWAFLGTDVSDEDKAISKLVNYYTTHAADYTPDKLQLPTTPEDPRNGGVIIRGGRRLMIID